MCAFVCLDFNLQFVWLHYVFDTYFGIHGWVSILFNICICIIKTGNGMKVFLNFKDDNYFKNIFQQLLRTLNNDEIRKVNFLINKKNIHGRQHVNVKIDLALYYCQDWHWCWMLLYFWRIFNNFSARIRYTYTESLFCQKTVIFVSRRMIFFYL